MAGGEVVPPDRYPRFVSETVRRPYRRRRRRRRRAARARRCVRRAATCSGARGARPSSTCCSRPGATRPVGAGDRRRPEEPDPFRLCFERDLDRDQALAAVAPARREVSGVHRPGRRPPAHPAHARGRGRAGRDRHRARRRALRAAHRSDRARARLRPRAGRARVGGGVLAVRSRRLRPRGLRRRRHARAS